MEAELRIESEQALRAVLDQITIAPSCVNRPDTHTGVGATESAVMKTAWLLAELIVRHAVDELSLPARARKT
jgi:hypothetical protein